jgi:hypothetical protein
VYAVLAHDDSVMLGRLVESLGQSSVLIHLDARVGLDTYLLGHPALSRSNVRFLENRKVVHWGGFSAVEAMMAFQDEIEKSGDDVSVVFLSGHCYPIRPVEHFETEVERRGGLWCRAYSLDNQHERWHRDRVLRRHWFDLRGRLRSFLPPQVAAGIRRAAYLVTYLVKRKVPIAVFAGSQWFAIPARLYMDACMAIQSDQRSIYSQAYAPDEMAFQSFIYNTGSIKGGDEDDLLVEKISEIPNFHFLRADMSGWLTPDDVLAAIAQSAFFVRKVSSNDGDVLDAADLARCSARKSL